MKCKAFWEPALWESTIHMSPKLALINNMQVLENVYWYVNAKHYGCNHQYARILGPSYSVRHLPSNCRFIKTWKRSHTFVFPTGRENVPNFFPGRDHAFLVAGRNQLAGGILATHTELPYRRHARGRGPDFTSYQHCSSPFLSRKQELPP